MNERTEKGLQELTPTDINQDKTIELTNKGNDYIKQNPPPVPTKPKTANSFTINKQRQIHTFNHTDKDTHAIADCGMRVSLKKCHPLFIEMKIDGDKIITTAPSKHTICKRCMNIVGPRLMKQKLKASMLNQIYKIHNQPEKSIKEPVVIEEPREHEHKKPVSEPEPELGFGIFGKDTATWHAYNMNQEPQGEMKSLYSLCKVGTCYKHEIHGIYTPTKLEEEDGRLRKMCKTCMRMVKDIK